MSSSSTSRKRPLSTLDSFVTSNGSSSSSKRPRPLANRSILAVDHPFRHSNLPDYTDTSGFRWLESIGKDACAHGINGEPTKGGKKIAAFDLDHTLTKPTGGKRFCTSEDGSDWTWTHSNVLKRLEALVSNGYSIVIISNQGWQDKQKKQAKAVLKRIKRMADALPNVPFHLFCSTCSKKAEDLSFRKPNKGMWDAFVAEFNDGIAPDIDKSFYVGDMAATNDPLAKGMDREMARRAGLPFYEPHEFFVSDKAGIFKSFDEKEGDGGSE